MIDDVWRHSSFLEELDSRVKPGLCVLATSRLGAGTTTKMADLARLAVHSVKLGRLSDTFVEKLRALVGTNGFDSAGLSPGQITRFIDTGQLLALSLTLQGGSLHSFAEGVLHPLRQKSSFQNFIDLCVIGRYDNTVPLSLLERSKGPGSPFWRDQSFDGLSSILETHGRAPRLRVGHSLVAQALVEAAEVDLVERAIHLCAACDPSNSEERRLIVRLFENTIADSSLVTQVRSMRGRLASAVARLLPDASFADAHRLAAMLNSVGEQTLSQIFLAAATPDRVADRIDIGLALSRKTHQEFNALFPRIFEFYERHSDTPGRRRFVRVARECGSHEQQVAIGEQTAKWSINARFPIDETLEVLHLSAGARTNDIALKIRPMIQAYLDSDGVSVEIIRASVRSVRRTRDAHLASHLVRRALEVLQMSSLDATATAELIHDLTLLLPGGLEDSLRIAMSEVILPTLEHIKGRTKLVKAVHAVILLGCLEAIEPLRRAILAVKREGWHDGVSLEKHFQHQFKLEVGNA